MLPAVPPGVARWHRSRRVWRLHDAGMTPGEIAAALAMPRWTVNRDMRRLKLRPRRRSEYAPGPRSGTIGRTVLEFLTAITEPAPVVRIALSIGNPERHHRDVRAVRASLYGLRRVGAVAFVPGRRFGAWFATDFGRSIVAKSPPDAATVPEPVLRAPTGIAPARPRAAHSA